MLGVASPAGAHYRFYPLDGWACYHIDNIERRTPRGHPAFSAKEQEIIAYLLASNTKSFTAAHGGGYAVTRISRGIVVRQWSLFSPSHRFGCRAIVRLLVGPLAFAQDCETLD
jgi:hypothetical protein